MSVNFLLPIFLLSFKNVKPTFSMWAVQDQRVGQMRPTGNNLLTHAIEGIGLNGLGCLFQCQNPRVFC